MPQENRSSPVFIVSVIIILAVVGYSLFRFIKKDDLNSPLKLMPTAENPTAPNPKDLPILNFIYRDGSYSSEGSYVSPAGPEKINVTLTIKDDVITSAEVVSLAVNPTSKTVQAKFISGYKAEVVGKKLSEVTLSKVSGSSLTPKGWNDAVAKIQVSAKA